MADREARSYTDESVLPPGKKAPAVDRWAGIHVEWYQIKGSVWVPGWKVRCSAVPTTERKPTPLSSRPQPPSSPPRALRASPGAADPYWKLHPVHLVLHRSLGSRRAWARDTKIIRLCAHSRTSTHTPFRPDDVFSTLLVLFFPGPPSSRPSHWSLPSHPGISALRGLSPSTPSEQTRAVLSTLPPGDTFPRYRPSGASPRGA